MQLKEPFKIYEKNEYIIKSKKNLDDCEQIFELDINNNKDYELKLNKYDIDINNCHIKTKNSTWFALVQNEINVVYNRYELKEGDIIKLGNVYLRLKKLHLNNQGNNNHFNIESFITFNNTKEVKDIEGDPNKKLNLVNMKQNVKKKININLIKDVEKKVKFCRICYNTNSDENNPLIHPCACLGSMKYIHFQCLKQWLNSNYFILDEKTGFSLKFKYKELKCELCKTKYPDIIIQKEKEYEIFDLSNKLGECAVLENLDKKENKENILYIVSLSKKNKKLKIGRADDNAIKIPDASISRNHCALITINNKLYIEDIGSKYGTLILIRTPSIHLVEKLYLYLQIGNNFIKCRLDNPTMNSFFCCGNEDFDKQKFDFYYKQNKIKFEENNKIILNTIVCSENESDIDNNKNINDKMKLNFKNKLKNVENLIHRNDNTVTLYGKSTYINSINIIPEIKDDKKE
mgnify:CR=1 FL=1